VKAVIVWNSRSISIMKLSAAVRVSGCPLGRLGRAVEEKSVAMVNVS
jgi:hypothetical protein